jgi:CubicO group peptidase (beta-lactamase class C family)
MFNHLSRRNFLSNTAKMAVAATVYDSIRRVVPDLHQICYKRGYHTGSSDAARIAQLDEYGEAYAGNRRSRAHLALANRDGLIRVSTYGFADTKAGLRVVPETMFEIGSISKSFVGLQPVARGRKAGSTKADCRIPALAENQLKFELGLHITS